jgi:MFS family permease
MPSLRFQLPFTATPLQGLTYLLAVCLFSISFLVFLNSTVSFVVTDRIGLKHNVGDAVGTLGFADELVVVVACPLWGMLSDRIGLRTVAVLGYLIVGTSLAVFVQARNVYPELLLGRMFFALGAAATAIMVTAILPTMTYQKPGFPAPISAGRSSSPSHVVTPSISSELTITPTLYQSRSRSSQSQRGGDSTDPEASTSQLSGLVGMFTGFGALLALGIFLPLPTRFQKAGVSPSDAIADSFYVVGAVALAVAIACFFGLRNLPSEENKSWRRLFTSGDAKSETEVSDAIPLPTYLQLFTRSLSLGVRDMNIGLGYLGGFVARASSVAISLFIPLFVNAYFISSGRCPANPDESLRDPSEIKENCRRAYILASILTGISQLVALVCAPIFGYLNAHYAEYKTPLLMAAGAGVGGYASFGRLKSPDPSSEDGSVGVYFIVALLGISQIGAIVSSLDLISRGIQTEDEMEPAMEDVNGEQNGEVVVSPAPRVESSANGYTGHRSYAHSADERTPLVPSNLRRTRTSRSRGPLKGSIAGMYSLCGGVGILVLTKVGGLLFDTVDVGVPFYLMAVFNAVLLVVCAVTVVVHAWRKEMSKSREERPPTLAAYGEEAET